MTRTRYDLKENFPPCSPLLQVCYLGQILMNTKPHSHAKMADSARTHMEAINAYANLDLREKIAKQVGYQPQGAGKHTVGCRSCRFSPKFNSNSNNNNNDNNNDDDNIIFLQRLLSIVCGASQCYGKQKFMKILIRAERK